MDLVSVVIPTLERPLCLERALASLAAQTGLDDMRVEIVVVDNSPQGLTAARLAGRGFVVVHEPRMGVASARNAGVAAARGRWIAFLDDDEEAGPGWLAALVAVARRTGAAAVFGPIEARAEGGHEIGPFRPYFSRQLTRADGADVTDLAALLGTNNSLFRADCLNGARTFDETLNETGGEDSLLLLQLARQGARFAFAARAPVIEWAPPRRLTWAYVRRRRFLSGQIRVFVRHMAAPRRWDVVLMWMGVGLAQFVLAGLAALALRLPAPQRAARAQAAAYGGLGKVFWSKSFRPALYGAGLVS